MVEMSGVDEGSWGDIVHVEAQLESVEGVAPVSVTIGPA